mmetsp:Transcript_23964/g.56750  ORF Transcript_23964/g.56750 Transcript_23964/m.56750 type:complete len:239 (+) Transcript_23964:211-927(+)
MSARRVEQTSQLAPQVSQRGRHPLHESFDRGSALALVRRRRVPAPHRHHLVGQLAARLPGLGHGHDIRDERPEAVEHQPQEEAGYVPDVGGLDLEPRLEPVPLGRGAVEPPFQRGDLGGPPLPLGLVPPRELFRPCIALLPGLGEPPRPVGLEAAKDALGAHRLLELDGLGTPEALGVGQLGPQRLSRPFEALVLGPQFARPIVVSEATVRYVVVDVVHDFGREYRRSARRCRLPRAV